MYRQNQHSIPRSDHRYRGSEERVRPELGRMDLCYRESIKSNDVHVPQNPSCICLQNFHKFLSTMFFKLGYLIALHPSYFIIIPVFITLLGATGIQQLVYEKDPEYLFSPTNGLGQQERRVVEDLFPVNYSHHFDPSRITRMSHFGILFISAKDNGSMFRVDVFNDVVLLDAAIKNLTIEWQGDTYGYEDVCAKRLEKCLDNRILNLEEFMPEIENGSMLLNYPIMLYPLVFPFYFGGPDVNETEGVIVGTRAVSLNYWLRDDDWKLKERSNEFEGKILELLDTTDFEHLHIARFVSRSLGDELDNNAQAITPYVALTVLLMVAFSVASVFLSDWVRSKLSVGIFGVMSATLATVTAFGFLMYCGVPFIGITMAAPFLMLGIGIDDMFVVLSAWHRTKIQDPVPIRLANTYSEAAVSITITSLTNMLSFFIGTITEFPAVRFFCLYTGCAILVTYIWFITFFGGCLAVAGYQERKRRHIITCRPVLSKSEAEDLGCCYSVFCAGGINPQDPWNPKDNKTHSVMIFFRDYLGKALNIPAVKTLVICMFIVYLAGAIYGCTRVEEGLERRRLTLDNSYLVDFFDTEDDMFRKYPYRLQIVINETLTYSDEETKQAVLELHDTFENLESTGAKLFTQSWMKGFYRYLDRRPKLKENITDEKSFIKVLKAEYLLPSSTEYLDVKFNEDESKIIASRFIVQAHDIKDTTEDKDMMLELRRVASESKFNVVAYHPFFVFFDQYMLVRFTCIQTITLAAVVMMVVSLIFIPNPLCSLWVAFSIVSIEIGVIGYMSLWGVSLDAISMINLIMCIGFSVDFSAHISYAYLTARATTPAGRVEECLYNLGLPVLQGGLSTIVGVLALTMAPSYIFTTFFKIVFLVIFFGLMHGLLLLPVMLSLLGPGSCSSHEESEDQSITFNQANDEEVPTVIQICELPHKMAVTQDDINSAQMNTERAMDRESMDRDLGLGSSGSSSQSSLHEADSLPGISDTDSTTGEGTHSRKTSTESGVGGPHNNEAFVPDDDEDEDEPSMVVERL